MTTTVVSAPGQPEPDGPYAPATLAAGSRVLSISGQVAHDAAGRLVGGDDVAEQARQALRNIDALVVAGGATKSDIARITVYLTEIDDRPAVALAREEYFGEHRPASTLVEVSALAFPELRVEIEATCIF